MNEVGGQDGPIRIQVSYVSSKNFGSFTVQNQWNEYFKNEKKHVDGKIWNQTLEYGL